MSAARSCPLAAELERALPKRPFAIEFCEQRESSAEPAQLPRSTDSDPHNGGKQSKEDDGETLPPSADQAPRADAR